MNKNINIFNKNLLKWYDSNKRDLIFRKDKDPYKILVSEIMSQQTQIDTMLPYYKRFIKKFPSVESLAQSTEEIVYKLWEGLGYYRRCKNLLLAAKEINYNGFPEKYQDLIKLPGVGDYTAGAIASIAFNEKVPAIDGNNLRVFMRVYNIESDIKKKSTKDKIREIVKNHLDYTESPGDFNQAVMELGALICLKNNPRCLICPISSDCEAFLNNSTASIPNTPTIKDKVVENYDVLIILKNNRPLYQLRKDTGLLENMYGFPMLNNSGVSGSRISELEKIYDVENSEFKGVSKHIFSHKIWLSSIFVTETVKDNRSLTIEAGSIPKAFQKMEKLI